MLSLKHDVVVPVQEHAMRRFRASEWIVPQLEMALFLLLLLCAAVILNG